MRVRSCTRIGSEAAHRSLASIFSFPFSMGGTRQAVFKNSILSTIALPPARLSISLDKLVRRMFLTSVPRFSFSDDPSILRSSMSVAELLSASRSPLMSLVSTRKSWKVDSGKLGPLRHHLHFLEQ